MFSDKTVPPVDKMFLLFSMAVAAVFAAMLAALVAAPAGRRRHAHGRPPINPALDAAYHARHGLSVCNNRHGRCPFPGVPQASAKFEIMKFRRGHRLELAA